MARHLAEVVFSVSFPAFYSSTEAGKKKKRHLSLGNKCSTGIVKEICCSFMVGRLFFYLNYDIIVLLSLISFISQPGQDWSLRHKFLFCQDCSEWEECDVELSWEPGVLRSALDEFNWATLSLVLCHGWDGLRQTFSCCSSRLCRFQSIWCRSCLWVPRALGTQIVVVTCNASDKQ